MSGDLRSARTNGRNPVVSELDGPMPLAEGGELGPGTDLFKVAIWRPDDPGEVGCDWYLDLSVDCSGGDGCDGGDQHDFETNQHHLGRRYISHSELLATFADAFT